MKTKIASLLVVIMITTTQCMAQKSITVRAENNDISNNLDLQAVATAFGESSNLEDFERKLNDYDSAISNLDLNNDGEVDYLRVIETFENNAHIIVIQAVLDKDVFQDVATIVVDRNEYNRSSVQIIGDPYLFGNNYIIDPVFGYTPSIFSFLWGMNYSSWYSPYYWGYYPNYYRMRNPWDYDRYCSHIQSHINHNYRYYYSSRIRNIYVNSVIDRIGRNDYANRHPERTFNNRNQNYRNKNDFNTPYKMQERPDYRTNESVRRNTSPTWTGGDTPRRGMVERNQNDNNPVRTNRDNTSTRNYNGNNNGQDNRNNNTYRNQPAVTNPTPNTNNNGIRNNSNNSYQQPTRNQQNTNQGTENKRIIRDNPNSRPTPVESRPRTVEQPKQVENRRNESNRNSSNNNSSDSDRKPTNESNRR
jgi:hypothetical protein